MYCKDCNNHFRHPGFKCFICSSTFKEGRLSSLDKLIISSYKFKCELCAEQITSAQKFSHYEAKHEPSSMFKCPHIKCAKKDLQNLEGMRKHFMFECDVIFYRENYNLTKQKYYEHPAYPLESDEDEDEEKFNPLPQSVGGVAGIFANFGIGE
jgi:hypothetical protein